MTNLGPFECLLKGFVLSESYGVPGFERVERGILEPRVDAIYVRPAAGGGVYRWLLEGARRSENP